MRPTASARLAAAVLAGACAFAAPRTDAAPVAKATKPAAHAAAHRPAPRSRLAPLDEYFGRLKMSVLGVRLKVTRLGLDADYYPEHAQADLNAAVFVEDAMRDWARKYPYDYWLPRYAYALETMYERIPGDAAHRRAIRQVDYITAYFPASVYARVGRAKLVAGVPTPVPGATAAPDSALQRLALIDGKVQPTLPPVPVAESTPVPDPAPTIDP